MYYYCSLVFTCTFLCYFKKVLKIIEYRSYYFKRDKLQHNCRVYYISLFLAKIFTYYKLKGFYFDNITLISSQNYLGLKNFFINPTLVYVVVKSFITKK